jgi:K+-transporting ATPase KdpF subunit
MRPGRRLTILEVMSIELIAAGLIGVFLLVYLVYSMIRPEEF